MERLVSSSIVNWRIGLAAIALQKRLFGAREDVPIDVAQIVAGRVRPILGELLAESEIGERCKPEINPSTTVLATRSRLEIPASTDGSRNRCNTLTFQVDLVRWRSRIALECDADRGSAADQGRPISVESAYSFGAGL